jgi:nucleotide-binding universal stress UspA family protein
MPVLEVKAAISIKNILFATDFSASSELALPYVKALARHYGATVFLGHVYHGEPLYEIPLDPLPPEFEQRRQMAEHRMNTFLQVHDFGGVPYHTVMRAGEVWPALASMIEENHIDLIVISTHGREGLKKLVLGSVAEEVLRLAPCPVLSVGPHISFDRGTVAGEFRHIVFATNFSPASEHALTYALSLGREAKAHISLLHVVEEASTDAPMPYPEAELESTQQRLRAMVPADAELWCEPEVIVETGVPADAILELARNRAADLIVMGVHRSRTPHASAHVPWRTAHRVICHADCPVLTVRS